MTKMRDLPLEEKLKIPVRKLPFSQEVKAEFERKGVYGLEKLYYKFIGLIDSEGDMLAYLPGFTTEAYNESLRLLSALSLIPNDHRCTRNYIGSKILSYLDKDV